jgi:DNA-binding CsgD family transcriptional regulator
VERLRRSDLERINSCLRELYEFADLGAFRARVLTALAVVVPADRVTIIESNVRLKQVAGESHPSGAFDGDLARAYGQYFRQSPLIQAYRRGDGSAVKYSDFLTQRQLRRLGLYNEYLRKLGAEYRMAKGLPGRSGWVTSLQLDRSVKDFSERDRLILNVLRPHLNQSYENAVAVSASRTQVEQIGEGVEALDQALVVLTPEGMIRWMSSRARQWLAAYFDAPRGCQDALPDPLAGWLRTHTGPGTREVSELREPLIVMRETTQLVVRFASRGTSAVLVLEEQYRSISPDALRPLGLTRRETEVLAWVVEGKTSAGIASILGMSRRSVEKHLEHIYPKLGVETRTAAAARALALLANRRPR